MDNEKYNKLVGQVLGIRRLLGLARYKFEQNEIHSECLVSVAHLVDEMIEEFQKEASENV